MCRPVQADHGLAGTGRAADPRRPWEGPANELGLLGMQERHPLLDRLRQHALEKSSVDLLRAEQGILLQFVSARGQHRLRDGGDHRRRSSGLREQHQRASHNDVDLRCRQPAAVSGNVAQGVPLANDPDAVDRGVQAAPPSEHDHRTHYTGREPDFSQVSLGNVGQVREAEQFLGDVGITAIDPARLYGHFGPSFGVDDEDTARSDDDEIDLSAFRTWPAAIGKQKVAQTRKGSQRAGGTPLGHLGDAEPAGSGAGLCGSLFVSVGQSKLSS